MKSSTKTRGSRLKCPAHLLLGKLWGGPRGEPQRCRPARSRPPRDGTARHARGGERNTAHHSPGSSIGNRERTGWAGPRALPAVTAQHRAGPATALHWGPGARFRPGERARRTSIRQSSQWARALRSGPRPPRPPRRPRCFPSGRRGPPPALPFASSRAAPGGWRVAAGTKAGPTPQREAAGGGLFCEPEVSRVNERRARARRHFPSLDSLGRWEKGSVGADRKRPGGWGGRAGLEGDRGWRRCRRGMGAAWRGRPAPAPSASRPALHGRGEGSFLTFFNPPFPRCNLAGGKSGPRSSPIGRRLLPL